MKLNHVCDIQYVILSFQWQKLTNISGNGGLRGDRICEETKEVFDGPIKCPAGTPSGEFKS